MSRVPDAAPRIMVGATSTEAGVAGYAPTPTAGNETTEFLRKDGTYAVPAGSGGGGGVPDDNSVTNAKVAAGAAIALSKLATDPLARGNHTGTQSADTLTDGTTNKAFLATERTKLSGIASSATANDTDVNLKARANHTGTQTASTISDFASAAVTATASAVATRQKKTTVSATAPSSPAEPDEWVDTTTGIKWTWIEDGDSGQWVDFSGPNLPAQVSGGERTAGTETALRSFSPADVKSMVNTHAPISSDGTLAGNSATVAPSQSAVITYVAANAGSGSNGHVMSGGIAATDFAFLETIASGSASTDFASLPVVHGSNASVTF